MSELPQREHGRSPLVAGPKASGVTRALRGPGQLDMSDYTVPESPMVTRAWCPGCDPDIDPTRELVYTRWCDLHQPGVGGAEDARVTAREGFALHAPSEGDAATCRAFAAAITHA